MNKIKSILLIKPSSLGDIVHGLSVLKPFREKWPDAKISWLVKDIYAEILLGNPYIDELILLKKSSLTTSILAFRRRLLQGRFDLAVDLQGLFRSGLISYLSGAPIRAGFRNARELAPLFYTHKIDTPISLHAVDRNLQIAAFLGCESREIQFSLNITQKALSEVSDFLYKNHLNTKKTLIVLAPGGRWEKKRWPAELFSQLGILLKQELQAGIILIGNTLEENLIDEIEGKNKNIYTRAVGFPLSQLTALLSKADVMITNDSGPMHIAAAVGTPTVALFGPTDPKKTGPYSKGNVVIQKNVECIPCFRKPCIYNNYVCMESISVEEVFNGVKQILTKIHPSTASCRNPMELPLR